MEIHIIRHIEPAIEKGICYGQTDVLLHDGYEKTHKQIAKNIDTDFSQIYSSPLLRCKLLAQEISKDIIYDVRLMEVNFGDWEMKKWDEINKQEINLRLSVLTTLIVLAAFSRIIPHMPTFRHWV